MKNLHKLELNNANVNMITYLIYNIKINIFLKVEVTHLISGVARNSITGAWSTIYYLSGAPPQVGAERTRKFLAPKGPQMAGDCISGPFGLR